MERKLELLNGLLAILYEERGQAVPPLEDSRKAERFRALCNVRPPLPVSREFLCLQDEYLSMLTAERGVVDVEKLDFADGIALWQGDITRLNAEAIVNACNPALLGCFQPLHSCIDNVIHSFAGVQVRLDCQRMMRGREEPCGSVRVTSAYNLPSRFLFHTVGPRVCGRPTQRERAALESCYTACLDCASAMRLASVAFCCLSTGLYGFPQEPACGIAVAAVRGRLSRDKNCPKVIFNVFTDRDAALYRECLARG